MHTIATAKNATYLNISAKSNVLVH